MVKVIGFIEKDFGEGMRLFSEDVVVLSAIRVLVRGVFTGSVFGIGSESVGVTF